MSTYRVVVLDADDFRNWQVWPTRGDPAAATKAKVAEAGEVPFCWSPTDEHGRRRSFLWLCPGCGVVRAGLMGDVPVSGWDSPRWVNTGTDDKPTLTPSLGCGAWRKGICPDGHWWLRDGELVPA